MEQSLLACLQVGDDKAAESYLGQLTRRFSPSDPKVMALRGVYQEATAKDDARLEDCLHEYERILSEDPVNVVCASCLAI